MRIFQEREDGTRFVTEIGDGTPLYLVVELRFARVTEGGIDDVEFFAPPEGRQRGSFLARGDVPLGQLGFFVAGCVLRRLVGGGF